jgi:geranylgeranyl pyrophosphate synthase
LLVFRPSALSKDIIVATAKNSSQRRQDIASRDAFPVFFAVLTGTACFNACAKTHSRLSQLLRRLDACALTTALPRICSRSANAIARLCKGRPEQAVNARQQITNAKKPLHPAAVRP